MERHSTETDAILNWLRKGVYERDVPKDKFVKIISDLFDLHLYTNISHSPRSKHLDKTYSSNKKYWNDSLSGVHYEGMRIELDTFHLTEWVPLSPGRFFTKEAEEKRKLASTYFNHHTKEYFPLGKQSMFLGGIGSVRLSSKESEKGTIFILGASSSGNTHEGVPVILYENGYRQVIETMKGSGGCLLKLMGTIRILPTNLSIIHHDESIPKYCLLVDDIDIKRPSLRGELLSTIAVMYPSGQWVIPSDRDYKYISNDGCTVNLTKSWVFASFNPAVRSDLENSVNWIKKYLLKHVGENAPILSDCDEHYNHFGNLVEFPINQILKGNFNQELLRKYGDFYQVSIKELVMGDKFENIRNTTIINRSVVTDAIKSVRSSAGADVSSALESVAAIVEESKNAVAGSLFNSFSEELAKPAPDKSTLRQYWDGLISMLPIVTKLAEASAKITTLFV